MEIQEIQKDRRAGYLLTSLDTGETNSTCLMKREADHEDDCFSIVIL